MASQESAVLYESALCLYDSALCLYESALCLYESALYLYESALCLYESTLCLSSCLGAMLMLHAICVLAQELEPLAAIDPTLHAQMLEACPP